MTPILPTPEGVIFDWDGTLADTFALIVDAWNAATKEPLGRVYTAEEVYARFGIPEHMMLRIELADAMAGKLSDEDVERAVQVFHNHYEREHGNVAFEGVDAMLRAIHAAGIPMGVMTGKGSRTAAISIHVLGWDGLFGSVVTGDDVQEQKPHPEGALKAAREISADPEKCVFVGDNPLDIQAGRAAGMRTIAAAWHVVYLDSLRESGADFWAESPADVVRILGLA